MSQGPTVYKGLAASPGIGMGYAHLLNRGKVIIPKRKVSRQETAFEIARLNSALENAREQLQQIRRKVSEEQGDDHVYLIEAQILMLEDKSLTDDSRELIQQELINAEWAVQRAMERFKKLFDQIDDEYFRDRRSDIEYVEERLLRLLSGTKEQGYVSIHRRTVIASHDLSPADILKMNRESLAGITMDIGGRTSHVSIIARSLGIPMVVGSGGTSLEVQNGERIIVDGLEGMVLLRPDNKTWAEYEEKRKHYVEARKELLKNRHHKAETKDQYQVHLLANIDFAEEVVDAIENGAEGVGMLRTEHLFLQGSVPFSSTSEELQFEQYKTIVKKMKPRETVVRLLDVAGDKLYRGPDEQRNENNPALGLRGIRFLLKEQKLLRTQMRAILRASAFGKTAVMYPMVSSVAEVRLLNTVLQDVMMELEREKVSFDSDLRVGTMIEVPSAALTSNRIAQEVDFLSIGTNDLIQYTLGVDRSNELVADLYNPLHGAIIQLLRKIVEMGHKAGIEVGVCGEMASEPFFVPLLVGLEFNFLSVNPASIPSVKQVIRQATMQETKKWVAEVCNLDDPLEIRETLSTRYANHFSGIFT